MDHSIVSDDFEQSQFLICLFEALRDCRFCQRQHVSLYNEKFVPKYGAHAEEEVAITANFKLTTTSFSYKAKVEFVKERHIRR